jgi:regulator of protease activity HflC (stomatin/prohibitin superfamily)
MEQTGIMITVGVIVVLFFGSVFAYVEFIGPMIAPWQAEQAGKAELAQAEQNRQIAVLEAKAKAESAVELANAEISRAKGVAQANQIIGESLKGNEDYLRYLWITDVAGTGVEKTTVYIPTEANLPILEASRMQVPQATPTR